MSESGQFVITKKKLMSSFHVSVLLLTMNFVTKLSSSLQMAITSWIHSFSDTVIGKFMISNRTDAYKLASIYQMSERGIHFTQKRLEDIPLNFV